MALAFALQRFAAAHGGVAFVSPAGSPRWPETAAMPDLGYVASNRFSMLREERLAAPDLVVHVDGGALGLLTGRAREAWFVDPVARKIVVRTERDRVFIRERTVAFGEPIPSEVVEVGDGGLGTEARVADADVQADSDSNDEPERGS